MKSTILGLMAVFALGTISSQAATVLLTNASGASGELGELLDGLDATDIGTSGSTVTVPGFISLEITLLSIASDEAGATLNSLSGGFGIDFPGSGLSDDSDAFDSAFNESASFSFNQDVEISSVSFVSFTGAEVFNFGGVSIADAAFSGNTFTFATPLAIAANTSFVMEATSGTVGIESFVLVPEPSTALLGAISMLALLRRRR